MDFVGFSKIPRLNRDMVITEKIDGTNAAIAVVDATSDRDAPGAEPLAKIGELWLYAQSRKRLLTLDADNYGFARWVTDHAEELSILGPGHHFGEWWGNGIQRNYGMAEKHFSLFNVKRWADSAAEEHGARPPCCDVVPVLEKYSFDQNRIATVLNTLRQSGSYAAPGFMDPEGIVVYHVAARQMFKVTLEGDEKPKGTV